MPQDMTTPRTFRFAPSPNGHLHRGHAYSAMLNYRAAAVTSGRFLVRIEDIDPTRDRDAFRREILDDLAWLGVSWEGPAMRQSERLDAYREALNALEKLDLLYPSFLSRSEAAALILAADLRGETVRRDPEGTPRYPGGERDWPKDRRQSEMASGRPYALRLDMQRAVSGLGPLAWREENPFTDAGTEIVADPAAWGDVVLARRDAPASYHLAVTVDDMEQEITDVVRGEDLRAATSVHRLLQTLLGYAAPRYFHHPLILDETGKKLSKSRDSETLRARRAAGETPEALIAGLGLPDYAK
jgi:glutamyl-Q tRNA(Asp) synthetase